MTPADFLHSPAVAAAILGLLGILASMHLGSKLIALIPAQATPIHTGHTWLDKGATWLEQCVEDVLRSVLQGDLLDNVLATLATGNTSGAVQIIQSAFPGIVKTIIDHLGDFGPAFKLFLGVPGLEGKIVSIIIAKLPEITVDQSHALKMARTFDEERKAALPLAPPAPAVPDATPAT